MKNNFPTSPVAYFVAEYALSTAAPTYAGGLGVLAGDYILEAGKEDFPFVLVSLRYRGYDASADGYELVSDEKGEPINIVLPIEGRDVSLRAWTKSFGAHTCALLLDPDVPENATDDRLIANELYDPHLYARVRQQFVLGAGGVAFFEKLRIDPKVFHLNEGHTGLTALAIIAAEMARGSSFDDAVEAARAKTVFSKHTILSEAGIYIPSHDFFTFVSRYCADHGIDPKKVFEIGEYEKDKDTFSTTKFGVRMSVRRNAVSALHQKKEKEVHPSTEIDFVTNGIFKDRWRSAHFSGASLFDAKRAAKKDMLDFVAEKTGVALDPEAMTIVWARRFAAYKRPELLFSDPDRLEKILSDEKQAVQIVISGKAHPADEESQKVVALVKSLIAEPRFKKKIAYIPDYSLDIAARLVAGADLWLNTPIRGMEACGTSGMKAGLNGSIMCSISDGWMDEVDWTGIGWVLPEMKTAEVLYDMLQKEIVPEFSRRAADGVSGDWISRMEKTVALIETRFGADRMLADYRQKLYRF